MGTVVLELQEQPLKTEHRAWIRYTSKRDAQVQPDQASTVIFRKAVIHSISQKGLGILMSTPVSTGTILKVGLQGFNWSRLLLARVVHAEQQDDGWYHGCELANILSEAEVQELVS
jgi:hypothetical protein